MNVQENIGFNVTVGISSPTNRHLALTIVYTVGLVTVCRIVVLQFTYLEYGVSIVCMSCCFYPTFQFYKRVVNDKKS